MKLENQPQQILNQYQNGNQFKDSIGDLGLNEQITKNERFYRGDQWHGANIGSDKPLVRRNVIKRIGEYKQSSIGSSSPVAVSYSTQGIGDVAKEQEEALKQQFLNGQEFSGAVKDEEVNIMMQVLSDYFSTTAERVKFDDKKADTLRNAYVSGTGVAYTYWDGDILTGLYADEGKTTPIKGDIQFETLDIRNVIFGEPNNTDLQSQPYIIIAHRRLVSDVKREAKRNKRGATDIENIVPDNATTTDEPTNSKRCTVYTKFYKEWNTNGDNYTVKCVKTTAQAVVKDEWDTGLSLYPLAIMNWLPRMNNIYGDSDVTYQIPNQIAINRSLTATVWATMSTGMPIMVVNGDVITDKVTNNPGQVLKVYGTAEDVKNSIDYITPPNFSAPLINATNDLTESTLKDNGANDVALGDFRPDNASAIIQLREASLQPMQIYQNRFYSFIEDVARIWADFWTAYYGNRKLKIRDADGVYYVPFDASRYKDLIITARIDVGSSPIRSISTELATLDAMYRAGIINKIQYIERLPEGIIKDKSKLLDEAQEEINQQMLAQGMGGNINDSIDGY